MFKIIFVEFFKMWKHSKKYYIRIIIILHEVNSYDVLKWLCVIMKILVKNFWYNKNSHYKVNDIFYKEIKKIYFKIWTIFFKKCFKMIKDIYVFKIKWFSYF
jgi:hypothetical protein